ncbi:MAG: N4-gp56 family major capsid protein [Burkholderiales bacterium]
MATTTYGDISPRTAAYAEKKMLERGLPYLVLEKFGQAKPLPSNSTKVMKFRRYNALPTTPTTLTEGVTPSSQALTVTDVTATLSQYGGLTTISDVIMDTHEDDTLNEAITLLGEQAAQMIEKMRYGVLKAGTNVLYANGSARNAVNTPISITLQRRAVRALKRQNARFITSVVRSTPSYGTENVAPGYIALIHPDVEADVRGIASFVPAEKYGSLTPFENELGKIEDVRYLSSTIFEPWVDAGGAKGTMLSTSGTSADVYPVLFLGRDAYGIIALKGMFALTPMVVNPKPSDSDPLAQRGTVGWKAMQTAVILNDAFMARGEVAATA